MPELRDQESSAPVHINPARPVPPPPSLRAGQTRLRTLPELRAALLEVTYTRIYEGWVVLSSIGLTLIVLGTSDWALEHLLSLDEHHALFLRVPLVLYTLFHYVVTMGQGPIEWLARRLRHAPGEDAQHEGH